MGSIQRTWRTFWHGRKFAKKGRHCRFPTKYLHVHGHVELGAHCRFRENVTLRTIGNGAIRFSDRSGCSWCCVVEAGAEVFIGSYTGIAEYTFISDLRWPLFGATGAWHTVEAEPRPVRIGNQCFIGSRVYIGPGVTIGDGAAVGPHSVVTRDIGPYEVWAGVPARKVAHRTQNVPAPMQRQFETLVAQQGFQTIREKY